MIHPVIVIRDKDSSEVVVSTIAAFREANRGQLSREERASLKALLAGKIPEMPCGMGYVLSIAEAGSIEPYTAVEGDTESRFAA